MIGDRSKEYWKEEGRMLGYDDMEERFPVQALAMFRMEEEGRL